MCRKKESKLGSCINGWYIFDEAESPYKARMWFCTCPKCGRYTIKTVSMMKRTCACNKCKSIREV